MEHVTNLIRQRDEVIFERRQTLSRLFSAKPADRPRIYYEFVQPLGQELLKINRKLGL